MSTQRQAFGHFLELVAAMRSHELPRDEVLHWFLAGADAWATGTGEQPLTSHLGITRRLRRVYLESRQRDYLEEALQAFLDTHAPASDYAIARDYARLMRNYKRAPAAEPTDGASRLNRYLWLAAQLPIPVPASFRHWLRMVQAKRVDQSPVPGFECTGTDEERLMETNLYADEQPTDPLTDVDRMVNLARDRRAQRAAVDRKNAARASARATAQSIIRDEERQERTAIVAPATSTTTGPRTAPATPDNSVGRDARAEWARSVELQDEFGGDLESYLAYRRAVAAGRVRYVGGQRG